MNTLVLVRELNTGDIFQKPMLDTLYMVIEFTHQNGKDVMKFWSIASMKYYWEYNLDTKVELVTCVHSLLKSQSLI